MTSMIDFTNEINNEITSYNGLILFGETSFEAAIYKAIEHGNFEIVKHLIDKDTSDGKKCLQIVKNLFDKDIYDGKKLLQIVNIIDNDELTNFLDEKEVLTIDDYDYRRQQLKSLIADLKTIK